VVSKANNFFQNIYTKFPRANKEYMIKDNNTINLVPFGSNLSSTVNYPRYTIIVRYMIKLPISVKDVLVGLLLSDG